MSAHSGIGLVAVDTDRAWIGGRYYLHHLVRAVSSLPDEERAPLLDVSWGKKPDDDPFMEVRQLLAGSRVLAPPQRLPARLKRKVRRTLRGWGDARDLFLDAGVGALFPIAPCDAPGIPYVFWLTDFQYMHLPELFPPEMRNWYKRYFDHNVCAARLVVLSSKSAYDDFAAFYPDHLPKARVLRFCSVPDESWWALDPRDVAGTKGIESPYVIVCNQFSHHKNHDVLLAAMRTLAEWGSSVQLVCTGSTYGFRGDDYFKRLSVYMDEHGLRTRVHVLGLLPRAEQIALIRGASAVLQPSRFEGWSTIIEDAKSLGKAIVASDIAVHHEQLEGERGTLLPADDHKIWAGAILEATSAGRGREPERTDVTGRAAEAAQRTGRTFIEVMREAMSR
jgi:glycosyltransferase involved in cell wall biosynthesis